MFNPNRLVLRLTLPIFLALILGGWLTVTLAYADGPIRLRPNPDWFAPNPQARTTSLHWGDVDNDGDLDLVVGAEDFGFLGSRIYLNQGLDQNGLPVLTLGLVFAESDSIGSVAFGDADNDGDLDLALGNGINTGGNFPQANRIYLLELTQQNVLTITGEAVISNADTGITYSVAWGDADGDGDLDLAVGNQGQNYLYRNLSGGNFEAEPLGDDVSPTNSVAWGDADDDGDLDLAVGNVGQNYLYRNDGGGNFETVALGGAPFNTNSMAWGDVNGDGELDLIVANSDRVQLYTNNGSGNFTGTTLITDSISIDSSDLGDVDNDGDLDLVLGTWFNSIRVYRNVGGNIQPTPAWIGPNILSRYDVGWGDVDNDGDLDLASVGDFPAPFIIMNDGSGLPTSPSQTLSQPPPQPNTYVTALDLAWGDLDNDGDLDLAAGNALLTPDGCTTHPTNPVWSGAANMIYLNENGVLQPRPDLWPSDTARTTTSLAWGDVDGDGDLDLAVGNRPAETSVLCNPDSNQTIYHGGVEIYLNDNGSFSTAPQEIGPNYQYTYDIAWGDVDGDGDLDLAVANGGNNFGRRQSYVYFNENGVLQTQPGWTSAESGEPST